MGNIDVILLPESAPETVANFLRYVNRGAYANTFIHRSVRNFIIQGGGYRFTNNTVSAIPADPPVRNEYRVSNTRGTLAMAKLGNDPNSATNEWFFNTANNASNLNNQNGGFTVFGRVADAAGLAVMDRIAGVPIYNAGSPFDSLPLQNYVSGTINAANLVLIRSITVLEANPAILSNGVISLSDFGGFASAAPGSFIEIYGSGLAGSVSRLWNASDFVGDRAPSALEGVSVTIDGRPAYVNYVSATQVNVQVPADVSVGGNVPVVVTVNGRSSSPVNLAIRPISGGILAPTSFRVNDRQYVAAFHASGGALVSNGNLPGTSAAPAVAGETLTFYGIGFGPVQNGEIAGLIPRGASVLSNAVEFRFNNVPAQVTYAGLAPELVGVYQFNVVVPPGLPAGDVPLSVRVANEDLAQNMFISVVGN